MMKLKTNHGTFLSLTRDSSVKAVATGRTGFRVMSEGGKYVFTHESGKILGISDGKLSGFDTRTSASEFDVVPGEIKPIEANALTKTPSATPSSKMHPKTPAALIISAAMAAHDFATKEPVSVVDAAEDIKASIIPQTLHFSQASAIKTPESAKKIAPAATAPVPKASDKHRQKVAEKPAQATNAELPLAFSLYV